MFFHSAIVIAICLIYLTACMSKKDYSDLMINNTTDQTNSNQSISHLSRLSTKTISDEDLEKNITELSFLPKDKSLTVLDIPFTNNESVLDILKKVTSSMESNPNATKDDDTIEDKVESEPKYRTNMIKVDDGTNNKTKDIEKNESTLGLVSTDTTFSILNIPHANTEKTIEILKAAVSSRADNKTITKDVRIVDKGSKQPEIDMKNNQTTTNRMNKSTTVADKNNTAANDPLPANDIPLSELTTLSYNDGEVLTVGQKIEFQSSHVNSASEDTNSAGVELLKNISGICGSLFGKRISFANETTLMEFPWSTLLLYNTKIRYHCGGSLITRKYVLTAAHCVAQEFYELIGVRLGEHDIGKDIDCAPDLVGDEICATTIDVKVVKIIVHHAYSHLSFKNDIALLRLDQDYINRSFYPICIPTPEMMYSDTKAIVAGWGATEKALRSSVLLKAEVPIYDISKCREIYRYSVFNDSTEICGSGKNEVDVCKGDSGGALFHNRHFKGKDKYYQLGIISLGVRRCGDSRFLPAVFTKLNGFYKWIEDNLEY